MECSFIEPTNHYIVNGTKGLDYFNDYILRLNGFEGEINEKTGLNAACFFGKRDIMLRGNTSEEGERIKNLINTLIKTNNANNVSYFKVELDLKNDGSLSIYNIYEVLSKSILKAIEKQEDTCPVCTALHMDQSIPHIHVLWINKDDININRDIISDNFISDVMKDFGKKINE